MARPRKDVGPRPLCKCHGLEMIRPSSWTCSVRVKEWDDRVHQDAEFRARKADQQAEYRNTPAGQRAVLRAKLNSMNRALEARIHQLQEV